MARKQQSEVKVKLETAAKLRTGQPHSHYRRYKLSLRSSSEELLKIQLGSVISAYSAELPDANKLLIRTVDRVVMQTWYTQHSLPKKWEHSLQYSHRNGAVQCHEKKRYLVK